MKLAGTIHRRSHTLLLWIISYVIILVVPMVISLLIYIASDKVLGAEINKANEASMKQMQQIIDDNLKSIRKISIDIGWDEKVVGFMRARLPLSLSNQNTMIDIVKSLKIQSTTNKLINFLYIYFKNSNIVLSNSASNDINEIYDFYHDAEDFQFQEWKEMIDGTHTWDYQIIPRMVSSGKINNSIAFIQTIPVEYPAFPLGNIVIMVDQEQFARILSEVKWIEESSILILDKNNHIIASSSDINMPESIDYERLTRNKGLINEEISGEKVIVSHIDSSVSDWKYVSIIPKSIFLSKAKYVRDLTLLGILFCLIIGGAAAYFLAKRNYNPVKRILETLSDKAGLPFNKEINEFDFINQSIELTVEQKESISEKLKGQYDLLKSNYLMKLIKGDFDENITIEEALSSYNIVFSSERFAVMVFLLEDINGFCEKTGEKIPEHGIKLARFVVANLVKELVEERNKVFVVEMDEALVCLVNFANGELQSGAEELEQITLKMIEILQNDFKIFFTGALSSVHETPVGISKAYQEALEALEYKLVVGAGKVITYNEIKKAGASIGRYEFTIEMQQKFINCIKAEDFKEAEKIMEDIISSAFSKNSIPIAMSKCIMFAMVNTMINAIKELSIVCDSSFLENLNPVDRLLNCKTVMDMKYEMKTILGSVEEYISSSKEEKYNNLSLNIRQFIDINYKDSNLNVSTIAEHFGMNPVYLSRNFKQQEGVSLLDYLNQLRLEKAKQLLEKGDININDIAGLVGYYNSNAFIRTFRKYEGITPGKYRELV